MQSQDFNTIIHEQIKICLDVLVKKADEYATEDRLHNFKVAATLQDHDAVHALGGMMAKHTVSIYDMINSGKNYPMDMWEEKITDHINYLLILKALIEEAKTVSGEEAQADTYDTTICPYCERSFETTQLLDQHVFRCDHRNTAEKTSPLIGTNHY